LSRPGHCSQRQPVDGEKATEVEPATANRSQARAFTAGFDQLKRQNPLHHLQIFRQLAQFGIQHVLLRGNTYNQQFQVPFPVVAERVHFIEADSHRISLMNRGSLVIQPHHAVTVHHVIYLFNAGVIVETL